MDSPVSSVLFAPWFVHVLQMALQREKAQWQRGDGGRGLCRSRGVICPSWRGLWMLVNCSDRSMPRDCPTV